MEEIIKKPDAPEDIKNFLVRLYTKLTNVDTDGSDETNETQQHVLDQKRSIYYLLKNLYDKWLCGYTANEFNLHKPEEDLRIRKERFCNIESKKETKNTINSISTEYNNFVYVDQYFNDISSLYMMDVDAIGKAINDTYTGKENMDIYSFMSFIAEKNNLMLIALPVYNNMYNAKSIASVFSPNTLYNMNIYDESNGIGTTYVVMHTDEVSHQPSLYDGYEYNRDYIDIADLSSNSGAADLQYFDMVGESDSKLNYPVAAFAVSYGKQNQMYFKRVNVNMDNPKVTDEAIRNTLILSQGGSQGDTNQPISIGQNIYSIYSNRSYTCTVEMMGCANIMPLMYFQLNNIPMFRGMYMIINVRHAIKAGDMTTTFTGVRVSRYSLPDIHTTLLNSSIFNRLLNTGSWKDGKASDCPEFIDEQVGHFKLSQLIASSTASELNVCNNPNETQTKNLKRLLNNILNPLYDAWYAETGSGFSISSGFRSATVNEALKKKGYKPSSTSYHLLGLAADIKPDNRSMEQFVQFVKCWLWNSGNARMFKECIDEKQKGSRWVHIAYVRENDNSDIQKIKWTNNDAKVIESHTISANDCQS